MHGLIFMTWEKYLAERFGTPFLHAYRDKVGEKTAADLPLANRLYDDATLLAGVGAACELAELPADTLLLEYGQYFIMNGLTGHLCTYILTSVHSGRDLLLAMRDAHARLRRTMEGLQPPLFEYGHTTNANEVILIYDSHRQLCTVLLGAIEGAAKLYDETVLIEEQSCMKQGAKACRIKATFSPPKADPRRYDTPERVARRATQADLMKQIWIVLPEAGTIAGFTLSELQDILERYKRVKTSLLRPAVLMEALYNLQFAGYIMTDGSQTGDDFMHRRYWRVHRHM